MTPAFFRVEPTTDGEILHPEALAASTWADRTTVRGMASSGVLARAAEALARAHAASHVRPVRWTVDLSSPVPSRPLVVVADVQHRGRRTLLVDAELRSEHRVVARARGLWLAPGGHATGRAWSPPGHFEPPRGQLEEGARRYWSDGVGWSPSAADHANASRKRLWQHVPDVVDLEPVTPFQLAAAAADLASVTSHWGDEMLQFINVDITLFLGRLPAGRELGVEAAWRLEDDGIAVGTAVLHDRRGPFGSAGTSALAAGDRVVDPSERERASQR